MITSICILMIEIFSIIGIFFALHLFLLQITILNRQPNLHKYNINYLLYHKTEVNTNKKTFILRK